MVFCSCFVSCLACGIQHWILLAFRWSWVLVLRWRSLRKLLPIDITWGQEVSGGPMSWTRLFHLRGSGPTPSWSTKTLLCHPAWKKRKKTKIRTDRTPNQMVKGKLNRLNHTKKQTHTLLKRKQRNKQNNQTKTNRQNPRRNCKSKPKQTQSHKETYTYTLIKREKRKKVIKNKKFKN